MTTVMEPAISSPDLQVGTLRWIYFLDPPETPVLWKLYEASGLTDVKKGAY